MKIFYKKDYERVLGELTKLKKEVKKHIEVINENNTLKEEIENLKLDALRLNDEFKIKDKMIADLKEEKKTLTAAKGGLTKRVNELTKANENMQEKLKEYVSSKYLVRKIPSGRTPKGQKMKVTKTVSPKINNFLRKEANNE